MTDRALEQLLHEGEIQAQERFGAEGFWSAEKLNNMLQDSISPFRAQFIESLPFFFMATANADGESDCSYRGTEHDASGRAYPLLKVLDEKTLIFPDYRGNKLYNSLGNILVNGNVGMLFIDFASRMRFRVNGKAEIVEDRSLYADIWPLAQRCVKVTVKQAYGNCRARIPKMEMVSPTDSHFQDE